MAGGVAVIREGAATETEMKEAKLRMEDALNATRAAVEEGIIAGGGSAYIHASKKVAFCNALLVTFTGSRIPLSTISTYSSVAALKPVPGADSFTLLMITAPSSPAFAAI